MPKIVQQSPKAKPKTGGSIIDRIGPIEVDEFIRIALYGKSGTGKTTLWATFPSPILVLVCSGGSKSGELRSILTPETLKTVKTAHVESSADLTDVVKHVNQTQKFKTVVLDHATDYQRLILKEVVGLDEIPETLSWGIAKQQDWGTVGTQCIERLRGFLDMDANVVIIAQERSFTPSEDEVGDIITPFVGPALTPAVVGWLNPACDYICETFIRQKMVEKQYKIGKETVTKMEPIKGKVEYCLRTAPDPIFMTKFRVPKGHPKPEVIVNPNYAKIMKVIKGDA